MNIDPGVTTATAAPVGVASIPVQGKKRFSVIAAITNSAPAAGAFTAAITDICTKVAHGFLTGLKVQLTTTTTLPAGLSLSTDYFVIKIGADTFKLATTLLLAQAGTPVDITDTGTGVHTITPTALAGGSIKLQGSMDNSAWADLPIKATGDATKSGTVTATANFYLSDTELNVNYVRCYLSVTAGQLSVVTKCSVQG
jgi:hypothetical protein